MLPRTALLFPCLIAPLFAQVTRADYERAAGLRTKFQDAAVNIVDRVNWIDGTAHFWYRKTVAGGHQFEWVDAATQTKRPAFDHEKVAAAISAGGEKVTAIKLPFTEITYAENERAIQFTAAGSQWRCEVASSECKKTASAPVIGGGGGRGGRGGRAPEADEEPAPNEGENDVFDGMVEFPQAIAPFSPFRPAAPSDVKPSADGKWEAFIENYNVFVRPKGGKLAQSIALSYDGSEGNYYTLRSLTFSPDSKHIVAYRVRPGYRREVHYVESSPTDQLQPKHSARDYAKPGDTVDIAQPVLFDVETKKQTAIDNALFPNPYSLSNPVWWKDSRAFRFDYNQRGHQVYRVIEVDAHTGRARALISEESATFIYYNLLANNQRGSGKRYFQEIADGKELIWASERDGWNHLYLYDGATGKVKNQITKGNWVIRSVEKVDDSKREIWFLASGMHPGKDPYYNHLFRVNFDGGNLTEFTAADADHNVFFSPDLKYYTDIYSRVDAAPMVELHAVADNKKLMKVEEGDVQPLLSAGWRMPEPFMAMGRDGKTEIWGVIFKPANFVATKKYPVIEAIYAGPQGSFVPKAFSVAIQPLTELGFVVVQIDGMGTSNRSKAFHDVAFKNLGDAGFPDRIAWHKAAAAKFPWYDVSRVGIFGTSAGGQNAMGAVLFHPEFYKVAVANSGCHDNRMDKMWWNEQWMSWPIGPQYAASSNMENAWRLQGKLLLVVGELDTNVDPSSTYQVVNALIKANKRHELLYVPGGGHGAGGAYYQRLLEDYFVHNLMGIEPPDWNKEPVREPRGGEAN